MYYLRTLRRIFSAGLRVFVGAAPLAVERISRNTAVKAVVSALLALCIAYVVAATNTTALYANF